MEERAALHTSTKMSSACPAENNGKPDANKEDMVTVDLYPFIREYRGGRIERLMRSPFVVASASEEHGVATRDVVVDETTGVSARLFLPRDRHGERLPVIMYVHGGSFCTGSAFGRLYHDYVRSLAALAGALAVSVDYRLAPEHPVPAAYDDAWAALRWVASFSDPWLSAHGDRRRVFLAGDSVGATIVYSTAVLASSLGLHIEGLVMVHPYLLGSASEWNGVAMFRPEDIDRLWPFVTAGKLGHDDPRVNPADEEIALLKCSRVLVAVAEKDILRDRGRQLAARLRRCRRRAVTLVESEGEDHCFHLYNPLRAASKILMDIIVQYVKQPTTSSSL